MCPMTLATEEQAYRFYQDLITNLIANAFLMKIQAFQKLMQIKFSIFSSNGSIDHYFWHVFNRDVGAVVIAVDFIKELSVSVVQFCSGRHIASIKRLRIWEIFDEHGHLIDRYYGENSHSAQKKIFEPKYRHSKQSADCIRIHPGRDREYNFGFYTPDFSFA